MKCARRRDAVVLALPRGGVPIAFEVAATLELPLDVFVVRHLGFPGHEEFAIGTLASGAVRVMDEGVIRMYHISPAQIADVTAMEQLELGRHEVVCAITPEPFYSVGLWYEDFAQVTDAEVYDLLSR